MHVAFPTYHDDYGGGAVGDNADRDGIWRGSGCAPVTRPGGSRRTAGFTIPDLVYHAGDLPVYGNTSEMAPRRRGAAGAPGSCRESLILRIEVAVVVDIP